MTVLHYDGATGKTTEKVFSSARVAERIAKFAEARVRREKQEAEIARDKALQSAVGEETVPEMFRKLVTALHDKDNSKPEAFNALVSAVRGVDATNPRQRGKGRA